MTPEQIEALKREVFNAVKDDIIAGETIEGLGDVALVIDHLAATGRLLPEGCVAIHVTTLEFLLEQSKISTEHIHPKIKSMISAAKKG